MTALAKKGIIIAIQGVSGGSGASSLSCLLAANLSSRGNTCLLDMDVQFGSIADYCGLPSTPASADLLTSLDHAGREVIEGAFRLTSSGVRVLPAPLKMPPLDLVTPEGIDRMMSILRSSYDVILIDMPKTMADWAERILLEADVILPVMRPDIRAARNLSRLHQAIGSGDPDRDERDRSQFAKRLLPVLTGAATGIDIKGRARDRELMSALGLHEYLAFPEESGMSRISDSGGLLQKKPLHLRKIAKSVEHIASAVIKKTGDL